MKKIKYLQFRFLLVAILCIGFLFTGSPLFSGGTQEEKPPSASESGTGTKAGVETSAKGRVKTILSYLEGTVLINGEQGSFGQELAPGTTIETQESSYCDVTIGEKNIFRIGPDTITTFSIGTEKNTVQVERGSVGAVLERVQNFGGDKELQLNSPSMVAGVRGTVFYLKVEDPDTTFLCTCHGTVHQHHSALTHPSDEKVTASHHKAYRYNTSSDAPIREEAGMLYHDDTSMNSISKKIGVDIPWGRLQND